MPSANPLLSQWLKEWWDTAREQNSKGALVYRKAYESIQACPLTFTHPSEAKQLHGLGPKLCDRLTKKLEDHCREHGLPMPEPLHRGRKRASEDEDERPAKKSRKKTAKPYVPALRSGPYAILIALSTVDERSATSLTKNQIIEIAQDHCDSSFTAPSDPSKYYTAWNSMKTLESKDLVFESGRPTKKYMLTDDGWETARRVRQAQGLAQPPSRSLNKTSDSFALNPAASDDFLALDSSPARPRPAELGDTRATAAAVWSNAPSFPTSRPDSTLSPTLPSFEPVRVEASAYTVELLLDQREIRSTTDREYIQENLRRQGVRATTRPLELGDALWVARIHDPATLARLRAVDPDADAEVVLDYILERKRLDDLISSIKDGRFKEQKFRLRRSGIPHITYLIEDKVLSPEYLQRYHDMVRSAIASTQVVDGFFVRRTAKLDDSIRYLARMTHRLHRAYASTTLNIIPGEAVPDMRTHRQLCAAQPDKSFYLSYSTFAALASKSDTLALRDVFLKMLMSVRGVTGDRALAIQKLWPTPRALIEALDTGTRSAKTPPAQARKLVDDMLCTRLGHLVGRAKIGKTLSATIGRIWGPAVVSQYDGFG